MRTEIILAGKGGQGILLAGYLIGYSVAKFTNYQVSSTEEYGAETRGGTDSKMDIVISDEEIDFIGAERADVAIFMFKDQAAKYSRYVRDGATVMIDSTLVDASSLPPRVLEDNGTAVHGAGREELGHPPQGGQHGDAGSIHYPRPRPPRRAGERGEGGSQPPQVGGPQPKGPPPRGWRRPGRR